MLFCLQVLCTKTIFAIIMDIILDYSSNQR
nr:MAG TPA: hypothetical protein [Caudoviricetes sp.]